MINPTSTNVVGSLLSLSISRAQLKLGTAQAEAASGTYADIGLQLGAQSGAELSLRDQLNVLQTFEGTNSLVTTNMNATQNALDSLRSSAQSTLQSLTALQPGVDNGSNLQNLGSTGLQSFISVMNTTSNGQYVFGGINSAAPPIANYFSATPSSAKASINQAFSTTFGVSPNATGASSITPSAMQSFLTTDLPSLFQGAAWSTNWSSASYVNVSVDVAPGTSV